jgi:hypothetical protein
MFPGFHPGLFSMAPSGSGTCGGSEFVRSRSRAPGQNGRIVPGQGADRAQCEYWERGRRNAHPGRGAVRIAPGETRGMGRGRSRPSRRDGVNGGDLCAEGRELERRGDA